MLFPPALPEGFRYEDGFLSRDDEARLLADIEGVAFGAFEMRGVVARRRVAFFGQAYEPVVKGPRRTETGEAPVECSGPSTTGSYDASRPAEPMPAFLEPLRARAAAWAGVDAAALAMALINEYPPGAPIGWHRDAPQYDVVIGVSLGSPARMRLRPYVSPSAAQPGARRTTTHEIALLPRSIYLISGTARSAFEHSIPPVDARRHSITFRTLRARPLRDRH